MDKATLDKLTDKMIDCGETLHEIADKLGIKVFIENDFARFHVDAYFIDDDALHKTQHIVIIFEALKSWYESYHNRLFEHLENAFDKKEDKIEIHHFHNKPIMDRRYGNVNLLGEHYRRYCHDDINNTKEMWPKVNPHLPKETVKMPKIKEVRFNGPATIIFWEDDTKTVVKAHDEDVDYEKGLAMAIAKKALGNKGNYFNEIKKWLPKEDEETPLNKRLEKISEAIRSHYKIPTPREFSFEVKSTSINGDLLKELTRGTVENPTIQMSFEGIMKPTEKEPEDIVSEEFFKFSSTCRCSKAGYASYGDDHTRWDSYCHHEPYHGEIYCRPQNCPLWVEVNKETTNG